MQRSRLTWWQKKLRLKTLKELTGCLARVEKVLRGLQKTGASGKTLNDYAASLNSFCNWCIDRDYMEEHPLKKLKRFDATPKTVRRAITPEEIMRLLEVAPEHRRIFYETAFCSGLRAKELKSLTVHDLDLRRGGLHLHAKWTKNRMAGFQPLPSAVLEHLNGFVESGQAAALYRRNYIRHDTKYEYPEEPLLYVPSNTSRMIERDLEAAGIPKWTEEGKVDFHALRVSYVSLVVETGADLKAAQSLARHTTPELTMNVYARVRGSKLTEVAEAVGRIILPLANIRLAERNSRGHVTHLSTTGYTESRSASIPAASTINCLRINMLRVTILGAGAFWVKTLGNRQSFVPVLLPIRAFLNGLFRGIHLKRSLTCGEDGSTSGHHPAGRVAEHSVASQRLYGCLASGRIFLKGQHSRGMC